MLYKKQPMSFEVLIGTIDLSNLEKHTYTRGIIIDRVAVSKERTALIVTSNGVIQITEPILKPLRYLLLS